MKVLLTILLFLLIIPVAYSQRTLVRGRVVDENNQPLVGVSVIFKAVGTVTVTKADGKFVINVNDVQNGVLRVSFTGYTTQEVALKGRDNVDISMIPSIENLNDVIVISALGLTRKAKSVTYSQQSIDPGALTEARDVNITNGLAGKVAGLQVTTTGQPGGSSRVVVRGEVSLTGNNQPLWVVDGIPISNSMGDTRGDNIDYGNGAADLNPDDIESITVLKGPNAAALYGSQAANGAILVTTKKAKIDNTLGISVNQNVMWNTITEFPLYQNVYGEGGSGRLVTGTNKLIGSTGAVQEGTNNGSWGAPMLGQPYDNWSGKLIPGGYSAQPGNVKSIYQTSATNVSNISISKADALSSFRVSYTFTKSNDVIQNENLLTKHNVNLYASRKIGNFLTLDARILYTYQDTKNRTARNLDNASPMAAYVYMTRSVNAATYTPWADANGNSFSMNTLTNTEDPYWMLYEDKNEDAHTRVIGGFTATVQLTKSLSFRGQLAGDLDYLNAYQYKELGGIKTPLGSYNNRMQNNQNWNYEGLLMYNRKLKNFTLNAVLGTSLATTNALTRTASINSLLVHNMPSISNSNTTPSTSESLGRTNVQSVYGSATLGYKDFLFLDVTGRNDWSSTLPVANCSFFYPSIGGSFVFSELLGNSIKNLINYGKIRVSWAQVGNSAPAQSTLNTYSYGGLLLGNPYINYTTTLKNPTLQPEKTVSKEIGLDLSLFKSKIKLSGSVYQSNSTNQIVQATTTYQTGFTSRFLNAGEIQNKGIELSLSATVLQTKNFSWNLLANFSTNKNLVKSLPSGVASLTLVNNLGAYVIAMPGKAYGTIVGAGPYMVGDTTIVLPTSGRINGITQVDTIGNFHPRWIGSIGSSFKYGGFDFSFLVTLKMGGNIFSASYARANASGNTVASLNGRDAYFFSQDILNESDNERMGIGQTVGTTVTRYQDSARPKGTVYQNAYFAKTGANGAILLDKNGRMIPGAKSTIWMTPQTYYSDMTLNNVPACTYDATSVKLSEMVLGYTIPQRILSRYFIKGARLAFVGRNLWTIFKNTPQGIDPESANTSGNAQGIEAGGSFPYAQYGFDLKLSF